MSGDRLGTAPADGRGSLAPRIFALAGALGLAALLLIDLASPRRLVYDESAYLLAAWTTLDRHGLSRDFLLSYPEAAGILAGIVQWWLRPLTGGLPPLVRLVNPMYLVAVIVVVCRILRRWQVPRPAETALLLMGVPMVWVLAGLALTEMSGMFCAMAGLAGLLWALDDRPDRSRAVRVLTSGFSGLVLGVAFFSRPPFLVLAAAAGAALLARPRPWNVVLAFWAGALMPVVPVIDLWRGLTPPLFHDFQLGTFSVTYMVLSLGYAGGVMALICPYWYWPNGRAAALGLLAGGVAGFWLRLRVDILSTTVLHVLPAKMATLYSAVGGAALFGVGIAFLVASARQIWANRADRAWLVVAVGMLLVVTLVGKITHQFSSRYTGIAAPVMLLACARSMRPTALNTTSLIGGMLCGAASLCSYLWLNTQ